MQEALNERIGVKTDTMDVMKKDHSDSKHI